MVRKFVSAVSILLFSMFCVSMGWAGQEKELTAFSVQVAHNILTSGNGDVAAAKALGWITVPKAIVIDDDGDVILVGERDASKHDLLFDDLVLALRNAKKEGEKDFPGVSLDPLNKDRFSKKQKVTYFGNIQNTHFGMVCFQADLLLKKLGLGMEPLGNESHPNEWDIELDRIKSGYLQDPWLKKQGRSWFFPTNVVIGLGENSAVLHNITVSVLAVEEDQDDGKNKKNKKKETEKEKKKKEKKSVVEEEPAIKMFARSISEHFDEISKTHPILDELSQGMKLYALAKGIQKNESKYTNSTLQKFIESYAVSYVQTPEQIQTHMREESGLATELSIGGGISLDAHFYKVQAGEADAIRKHILEARPDKTSLSWTAPIELDKVSNWPPDSKDAKKYETTSLSTFNEERKNAQVHTDKDYRKEQMIYETTGWNPATKGQHLMEIEGVLTLNKSDATDIYKGNYGMFFSKRAIYSASFIVTPRVVLYNRFEVGASAPFEIMLGIRDTGFIGQDVDVTGGINNVSFFTRFLLLSGKGNWPFVYFKAEYASPLSKRIQEGSGWLPFAYENGVTSYSIYAYVSSLERIHFYSNTTYSLSKEFEPYKGFLDQEVGVKFPVLKRNLWSVGINYNAILVNYEGSQLTRKYDMIGISFNTLSKRGMAQYTIGVILPTKRFDDPVGVYFELGGLLKLVTSRNWY